MEPKPIIPLLPFRVCSGPRSEPITSALIPSRSSRSRPWSRDARCPRASSRKIAISSAETWKSIFKPARRAFPVARGGTPDSLRRDLFDEAVQLRGLEGLLHVPLRPHLEAPDRVLFLAFGGDDDDGNGLVGRLLLEPLQELEAVHDRHVDVEEDEVDPLLLAQLVEGLQAVHGGDELAVLVAGEEELVHLVDQRGVVYREDLPEHLGLSSRALPTQDGTWGSTTEPCSVQLVAVFDRVYRPLVSRYSPGRPRKSEKRPCPSTSASTSAGPT